MPGVPGAGLSGLIYVISALVALLVELAKTIRGRSSLARWLVVIRLSSLAAGIALCINVVYSVVKLFFPDEPPQPTVAANGAAGAAVETALPPLDAASFELLPVAPVLITVGTLALVLGATLLLGLALRRRGAQSPQANAPVTVPDEESPEAIAA